MMKWQPRKKVGDAPAGPAGEPGCPGSRGRSGGAGRVPVPISVPIPVRDSRAALPAPLSLRGWPGRRRRRRELFFPSGGRRSPPRPGRRGAAGLGRAPGRRVRPRGLAGSGRLSGRSLIWLRGWSSVPARGQRRGRRHPVSRGGAGAARCRLVTGGIAPPRRVRVVAPRVRSLAGRSSSARLAVRFIDILLRENLAN